MNSSGNPSVPKVTEKVDDTLGSILGRGSSRTRKIEVYETNGYLQLRYRDLTTGKYKSFAYLGALNPKREGTKRIPDIYRRAWERRKMWLHKP